MKLSDLKFWEKYWTSLKLPREVDLNFSYDRCLANTLKKHIDIRGGEIFEIGCTPGKWLAYMAKEFLMTPSGIEYLDVGVKATLENLRVLGITPGSILQGDFLEAENKINRQFDVVMSIGFIEHFDNVDHIVDLHLRLLKPGGILILGIPNFQGIYYFVQKILNKELLDAHNLSIMNLDYFHELGKLFSLQPMFVDYIGSFEPSLPIPKHKYGNPLQFMLKSAIHIANKIRKFEVFDTINHKYISSTILAIYRKSSANTKRLVQ